MSETVRCLLLCALTFALIGPGQGERDSVPAAITVYRNPEFFRNVTRGRERDDDHVNADKEDVNGEEFYDFDEDYRYPGEPKRPKPPRAPDFAAYYDGSPEFQPERREATPERGAFHDVDDKNELVEDAEPSHQSELEEEPDDEDPPGYRVPMDRDLEPRISSKTYDDSKKYYNPVFDKDMSSYSYPSSYRDLDYYSYPYEEEGEEEESEREKHYTDRKKGTREYLRDHSDEPVEDRKSYRNGARADSKHVFKAISKIGLHAFKPTFYVPYMVPKIKAKYKYSIKPRIHHKWRFAREVPDDSAYELSSDYDSDFEFV